MKIRPVGAELCNAGGRKTDRRTDMTKLIVAFRNLANAPKNKNRLSCIDVPKCYSREKIKGVKVDWACSTYWREDRRR